VTIQNIPDAYDLGEVAEVFAEQQNVRGQHIPGSGLGEGMTIEALPSWYAGTTFRSKLEADWAATLDTLGIHWEYEPETVTLPSGATYVPDFRLPEIRTWLEVKGTGVPRIEKAIEFGHVRAEHGELVLVGHPPKPYEPRYDQLRAETFWSDFRIERNKARHHHGYPAWTATDERTTWLARCRSCGHAAWITRNECRVCRRLLRGAHAYSTGESGLLFIDSAGMPAPG
jgi:hypothetical protein